MRQVRKTYCQPDGNTHGATGVFCIADGSMNTGNKRNNLNGRHLYGIVRKTLIFLTMHTYLRSSVNLRLFESWVQPQKNTIQGFIDNIKPYFVDNFNLQNLLL